MNKYQYITRTSTLKVRAVYAFGIFAWLLTLWGFSGIIIIDPVYRYVVAPLLLFVSIYHFISWGIILYYKKFDLEQHQKLMAMNKIKPTVDVFLPVCGESMGVLERTWKAVSKLSYTNRRVYVLDDSKTETEEHETLARSLGFTYIQRKNKGEMKKAGNLKNAFNQTNGEFIVIFDADFAPKPEFLEETLPYFSDRKIAIVQTPQFFEAKSQLEHGAAYVQEDFYRIIQVARDRLGGALCCGSNAVYRRSALNEIGGTAQVEHSEDAITGFRLTDRGYRVKYLPIILATGFCPDDIHSYIHQQHRWASGSMLLMKSRVFWLSKTLSIKQKLCYLTGFMYYLQHPVSLILSFQLFITFIAYNQYISFANAMPFYPFMFWAFVMLPMMRIMPLKFGSFLASTAQLFTFTNAVINAFFGKAVEWIPTNTKQKNTSIMFRSVQKSVVWYLGLYLGISTLLALSGLIHPLIFRYYTIQFWMLYNIILSASFLFIILSYRKKERGNI